MKGKTIIRNMLECLLWACKFESVCEPSLFARPREQKKKRKKRWRDNEPVSATAICNQELTLWIIKALQAQEREGVREEKKDRENIARVSNPISPVHGVCACVCLRIYICVCARSHCEQWKSNLESKPESIWVCVRGTTTNLLSLRPPLSLNQCEPLWAFLCLTTHVRGFVLCPCLSHIDAGAWNGFVFSASLS